MILNQRLLVPFFYLVLWKMYLSPDLKVDFWVAGFGLVLTIPVHDGFAS
jgi:hypothetical protein